MSKIILRAALTLALTASFLSRSESDLPLKLTSLYESDWHLAQDIFVNQPRAQTDTLLKTAVLLVASVASGYLSNFLTSQINLFCYKKSGEYEKYEAWYTKRKQEIIEGAISNICSGPSGFLKVSIEDKSIEYIIPTSIQSIPIDYMVVPAIFLLLRKNTIYSAELEQMEKVMRSWPELRAKFPTQLHEAFDNLYALSTQVSDSTEYSNLLPKAVRLTKELLAIHFDENRWFSFIPRAFNALVY